MIGVQRPDLKTSTDDRREDVSHAARRIRTSSCYEVRADERRGTAHPARRQATRAGEVAAALKAGRATGHTGDGARA